MHNFFTGHKWTIVIAAAAVVVAIIIFEAAWLKFNGTPVPRPEIPRGPATIGSGPALNFVVLGDSTAVSQGSEYTDGYAVAAAKLLAESHTVTWSNYAVSGARTTDVLADQLPKALDQRPGLVLIAIGANDVTHLTNPQSVKTDLGKVIARLQTANPGIKIVLTGSPDMGSPHRLPQPLRWLAGKRTVTLNKLIMGLADNETVFFAPIAEQTGPVFRKHPEYFAADNFHPNAAGYAIWKPIVNQAIQNALRHE